MWNPVLSKPNDAFKRHFFLVQQVLAPSQCALAQSDVRDKMGRLVQYALLMLTGLIELVGTSPDAARREHTTTLAKLMVAIGDARRCFRWLKGVSPLLALCDGSAARSEVPSEEASSRRDP